MMDDETRFWIAQEVAETKDKHDARNLLRCLKKLMGKKPMTFITDGLQSYHDAYKKEFWTIRSLEPNIYDISNLEVTCTTTKWKG